LAVALGKVRLDVASLLALSIITDQIRAPEKAKRPAPWRVERVSSTT